MKASLFAAALAAATVPQAAHSVTLPDPTGDFLATYEGPQNAGLDIVSAGVSFDGTSFRLSATVNGPIGAPGSLYVFGVNRGSGTARLQFLGAPPAVGADVLFDAVAVLFPDGLGRVAAFPAAGPPVITNLPGAVTVSGNSISGSFDLSLLPSRGFAASDYTFTLWSRQRVNPAADGTNSEIADFSPTLSVPEPASWAMMIGGFGMIGCALRRRKVATPAPQRC
jgi:hypothetical protein